VDIRPKDSGGHKVQYRFFSVYHQGMPGIMPALESDHCLAPIGQKIDDLSFALITPLDSKDHYPS